MSIELIAKHNEMEFWWFPRNNAYLVRILFDDQPVWKTIETTTGVHGADGAHLEGLRDSALDEPPEPE